MHKITVNEWTRNVRNFMKRNANIEPMSDESLCRIVAADCYPTESFENVMIQVTAAVTKQKVDESIGKDGHDPSFWETTGVQGDLFEGFEVKSPRNYRMPNGDIASRKYVSIAFGIKHKEAVYRGLEEKLDAVDRAMDLDRNVIRKAQANGIDPNEVFYRGVEKAAEEQAS